MLLRCRPAAFVALGVSLLLAAGMVLSTASSAAAHDSIVSATPDADATIGVAPQEISLTLESAAVPESAPTPELTATKQALEPSPIRSTAESTDDGYGGQASGGGELFPVLAVISGVVIIGGALIVVLMVAWERRRRDRAATEATRAQPSTEEKTDGS